MGGCLPILLQMPFFFAFYKLLTVAIEVRQAEWLWVTDLSNPETLPIRVLPLAMVATQFWSQSLTPTPTADATQARLMKFMPLIFGFIFYQFQAGLVLYWLTTNCVGNRAATDPEPTADREARNRHRTKARQTKEATKIGGRIVRAGNANAPWLTSNGL